MGEPEPYWLRAYFTHARWWFEFFLKILILSKFWIDYMVTDNEFFFTCEIFASHNRGDSSDLSAPQKIATSKEYGDARHTLLMLSSIIRIAVWMTKSDKNKLRKRNTKYMHDHCWY